MEISNNSQLQLNPKSSPTLEDFISLSKNFLKSSTEQIENAIKEATPDEIENLLSQGMGVFLYYFSIYDKTTVLSSLMEEIDYNDGDVITEELLQRIEKKLDHALDLGVSGHIRSSELKNQIEL